MVYSMTETKLVLPGEQLSTSEELIPGEGTFEEDGIIKAARVGHYVVDTKHRRAMVKPVTNTPVELKRGNIVLAEVFMVKPMMVIANVTHVKGKKRTITGDTNGTLHVSEISKSYVKDPTTEFSSGDIIRAKITQVKPSVQLETKDKTFGVIKAMCSKCRHPLIRAGNALECGNCGNKERRRIAIDYGNYDINNL
jgi:exosome complex component CSL4